MREFELYAYLLTGVGWYLVVYAVAAAAVVSTTGGGLSPFKFKLVFREAIGAVLRMRKGVFRLSRFDNWSHVLDLNRKNLTPEAITAAGHLAQTYMKQRPWTYPPSQFRALRELLVAAKSHWELQEAFREAMAFLTGYRDIMRESRPSYSSWRTVLGVNADERDVSVIKKAYRKRAQSAHPDRGGSADEMAKLNKAIEQARAELAFV